MFDFHEKRKIKSLLYSKLVIGALFMFAIFLSFSVYDRYVVAEDMKAKLDTKRHELEELKTRAQVLGSKVEYMKDDRGVEEELRNRFDVARKGEQVVILLDPKTSEQKQENTAYVENQDTTKKSFFDLFKFW
jgi:cell division protein FtsB